MDMHVQISVLLSKQEIAEVKLVPKQMISNEDIFRYGVMMYEVMGVDILIEVHYMV